MQSGLNPAAVAAVAVATLLLIIVFEFVFPPLLCIAIFILIISGVGFCTGFPNLRLELGWPVHSAN